MMNKYKLQESLKKVGKVFYKLASFVITDVIPTVVVESAKVILKSDTSTSEQKQRAARNIERFDKKK